MPNITLEFTRSIKQKDLNKTRFYLTHPIYKDLISQELIDNALTHACWAGSLDIVQFLLTSPEIKYHANIYTENNNPIRGAIEKKHLDIIRYLLSAPDLKDRVNIHVDDNLIIKFACALEDNLTIVKYLISQKANIDAVNKEGCNINTWKWLQGYKISLTEKTKLNIQFEAFEHSNLKPKVL